MTVAPPTGDEPVVGKPVEPLPGSDGPRHEPFTPYEYGGPAAAWSYEQLTPEEKVAADRGLNEDQTQIQAGYAAATAALAVQASAERAAIQLGSMRGSRRWGGAMKIAIVIALASSCASSGPSLDKATIGRLSFGASHCGASRALDVSRVR